MEELQAAIKIIEQQRASSPSRTSGKSEGDELQDEVVRKRPRIRKKSGELMRPTLRAPRRPSTPAATPTYSKAVHFDSHLEHVRHFLQVDRPLAVSEGSSPVESYESEVEFPLSNDEPAHRSRLMPYEWEIRLANFPADSEERKLMPVCLERIFLSSDNKNLVGVVAVANIAYSKYVTARFTLDCWKTTSEVVAEYNNDVRRTHNDGRDRFNFSVKLTDQTYLENMTMLICIRYNADDREFWDNNNSMNYRVDFAKKPKPQLEKNGIQGLGARPLKPKSIPLSFDDFTKRLGESPIRMTRKSSDEIIPDGPARRTNAAGQAFGNRYDFGASLSAAIQAASSAPEERVGLQLKDEDRPESKQTYREDASANGVPASGTPLIGNFTAPASTTTPAQEVPGTTQNAAATGDALIPMKDSDGSVIWDCRDSYIDRKLTAETTECDDDLQYPSGYIDDASSCTPSYAESICSEASVASSATSQFSTHDLNSAADELVALLAKDETLQSLCFDAIRAETIGLERFTRNFRRLLKVYSKELKNDAREHIQVLAAQLVQSRSRYISISIVRLSNPELSAHAGSLKLETLTLSEEARQERVNEFLRRLNVEKQSATAGDADSDQSDSEDDELNEYEEPYLGTLKYVSAFLISGPAFKNLQQSLRQFVHPSSRDEAQHRVLERLKEAASDQKTDTFPSTPVKMSQSQNVVEQQPAQNRYDSARSESKLYALKVVPNQQSSLSSMLSRLKRQFKRWARPPVKKGHRRMEWSCVGVASNGLSVESRLDIANASKTCGQEMYRDFDNGDPEGLDAFLANFLHQGLASATLATSAEDSGRLDRKLLRGKQRPEEEMRSPTSSTKGSTRATVTSSQNSNIQRGAAQLPTAGNANMSQFASPVLEISNSAGSNSHPEVKQGSRRNSSQASRKFLEVCINTGQYTISLGEIDVTEVENDGELFAKIKQRYHEMRGFRIRRMLLRPVNVHFVRVSNSSI